MSSEIQRAEALARENRTLCDLITLRRQLALVDRTLRTAIEHPYQVEGVDSIASAFRFAHGLLSASGLVPPLDQPAFPYPPSPAPTKGPSPMPHPNATWSKRIPVPPLEHCPEQLGDSNALHLLREPQTNHNGGVLGYRLIVQQGTVPWYTIELRGSPAYLSMDRVHAIAEAVLAEARAFDECDPKPALATPPRPAHADRGWHPDDEKRG